MGGRARNEPRFAGIASQLRSHRSRSGPGRGGAERKRSEEALYREREQLLSIFDGINEAVYVADTETYEILYANRRLRDAFGRELVGGVCYREFQGLDEPCAFCTNTIILANKGEPYRWEYYNPTLDRYYAITDEIIRWPDGRDVRFELAVDISEQKRAQGEIRKSEEKYRLMVENAQEGIWAIDADANTSFVNQRMAEMLGYTVEEMAGRHLFSFMDERGREMAEKNIERRRRGLSEQHDFEFLRKDGKRIYTLLETSPQKNEDGGYAGALAFVADVTERRHMEEALKQSEARYRELAESITDVFFAMDTDLRYIYWNRACEELTGIPAADAIGRNIYELFPDEQGKRAADIYGEVIRTGQARTFTNEYPSPDGKRFYEMSAYPAHKGLSVFARDITAHKQAEEALRESEEYQRKLIESAYDFISVLNEDGSHRYLSSSVKRVMGYGPGELMRQDPFDLIHPEDGERVMKAFRGMAQGPGGEIHLEYRARHKDGTWRVLETAAKNLLQDPVVGGIVINTRDITEHKRAQEELKAATEMLSATLRSVPVAIIVCSEEGRFIDINDEFCRLTGYERGEVLGKSVLELGLIEPGDYAAVMRELVEKGEVRGLELTGFTRREKPETVLLSAEAMAVAGERRILASAFEITASKEALERLEQLNHLFLSLGADIIANMERIIETGRELMGAELVNYCRMQGGKLIRALSTAPEEVPRPVDRPEDHLCYEVIDGGGAHLAIEDLDGTSYTETDPYVKKHGFKSFLGYPVVVGEKTIGALSLFDTRRRKYSQDELELLGTLARAMAAEEERLAREESMKDFIDIASHELRHPLTLMKGFALSLRNLWERLDQEKIREMLDAIDQGADRLNRLVLGLLDLSRIERGRFSIDRRDAELTRLIEEAVGDLRRGGVRNEFKIDVTPGAVFLHVDPERIAELLIILLENAIKFSPPEAPIEIGISRGDGEALVSVLDRGMGVPENYRAMIFERFAQVEDALHHSIPGMGMGLYIAREIVEAHGGRIWCEPREGGGSAFRFSLTA